MDPDECLRRIRELLDDSELAERVRHLDTWLTSGGFLPDDWRKNGRRTSEPAEKAQGPPR